jgi:hypothetical protein
MDKAPMSRIKIVLFYAVLALCGVLPAQADDPVTTIEITGKPLVKEVSRFGINIGGDSYYTPPKLKTRYQENFEGTVYRQCHNGLLYPDGFLTVLVKKSTVDKWWGPLGLTDNFYPGATITFLSGPHKWEKRTLKELTYRKFKQPWEKEEVDYLFFAFDTPVELPDGNPVEKMGILIEQDRRREGCINQLMNEGSAYWASSNAKLLQDDIAKDSFGYSALLLDATENQVKIDRTTKAVTDLGRKEAYYRCSTTWEQFMESDGLWHVKFKAKDFGDARLSVKPDGPKPNVPAVTPALTSEWKEFDLTFTIAGVPSGEGDKGGHLLFVFENASGKALVDDIQIWQEKTYENPTVFNDEFLDTLKYLRVGIVRRLMMGGTMYDTLALRMQSCRADNSIVSAAGPRTSRGTAPWGMGDAFLLCEQLGAEAWFNVPGTLYPEEMDFFMEYIGGPVTTPGGKLRAEQGHPKPWTETLKKIHVEPGNEAWNTMFGFIAGGFNGPDYWQELFTRVKKSPYYTPKVICHSAGQNYSTPMAKEILKNTPSSDRYSIAPYQAHGLKSQDVALMKGIEDFYAWCMFYPLENLKHSMSKQGAVSKETGVEFSIYEVNNHLTEGVMRKSSKDFDPKYLDWVNTFVCSAPAAVANMNHMLAMLKDYGVRSQCFFTFEGNYHEVRLWGSVLNMKKGEERFRPNGLALRLVNGAIGGDLIETAQADTPAVSVTGYFPGPKSKEATTVENPVITSYAFKDGKKNSLILANMDLLRAHTVAIRFPGGFTGTAKSETLAPDNLIDTNEPELTGPKVVLKESEIKDFKSGITLVLKPASIQSIVWTE